MSKTSSAAVTRRRWAKRDRRWFWLVGSFFGFWALGLGFLWWVVVPPVVFYRTTRGKHWPWVSVLMTSLGLFLLAVLAASFLADVVPLGRALGAAFGGAFWICLGLLYAVMVHRTPQQTFHIMRGLLAVSAVQGFISLVAINLHPSPISQFNLPSSVALGEMGGVAPWTRAYFAYDTYFGESIIRSDGLQGSAAWSGGLAALAMLFLIFQRRHLSRHGLTRGRWMLSLALSAVSLWYSYSRVSYAIVAVVLTYYVLHRIMTQLVQYGELMAFMTVAVGLVFAYVFAPWREFLLEQDELRPGSSTARFNSYSEGLDAADTSGILSVLFGNGAKPLIEELGRGAGSESTYVSLLVRGGIVALLIFCAILYWRFKTAIVRADLPGTLLILTVAIHGLVEDLDVGTLTIIFALVSTPGLVWRPPAQVVQVGRQAQNYRLNPAPVMSPWRM